MKPYNPLDKLNLAEDVARELLKYSAKPLEEISSFMGAGIYALYYAGDFAPYAPYKNDIANDVFDKPIYVGKADPEGSRTGRNLEADPKKELYGRLRQHLGSVRAAQNIDSKDFYFRYLVLDDVWIPLGETLIISTFRPPWNTKIMQGFGIHSPGKGRKDQKRSPWDMVHPGRSFAENRSDGPLSKEKILEALRKSGQTAELIEG